MYYKIFSTEQTWFAAPLLLHQKKVKEKAHIFPHVDIIMMPTCVSFLRIISM